MQVILPDAPEANLIKLSKQGEQGHVNVHGLIHGDQLENNNFLIIGEDKANVKRQSNNKTTQNGRQHYVWGYARREIQRTRGGFCTIIPGTFPGCIRGQST